jgi:hypothetical protein
LDLQQGRGPAKPFVLTDKTGKKALDSKQAVPTSEEIESDEAALAEDHMRGCNKNKTAKIIQGRNKVVKQITKGEETERTDWKSIIEGAAEDAQALAKQIRAKARELGVQISVGGSTSVSFSKSFTAGSKEEFFKAYSDCDKIRDMVRFKSRVNEWGASTGGMGLGAQDDIKNGRVTIHKSGDGAAYLLKALDKIKF